MDGITKRPPATKEDKQAKERKMTNGNKERAQAHRSYGEEEKNLKKEKEQANNRKSEVTDEKKKEKPRMDDGKGDDKKKKESMANDMTKKMGEVKLNKRNTNETRKSKMVIAPLNEVAAGQLIQKRDTSMRFKLHIDCITKIHRQSSNNFNRKSTSTAVNDWPSEPLRSTHSSSSTSTFSSGKNEIFGYFSAEDCIDSFKIVKQSIILSRIEQDGTITEMTPKKFQNTPAFMCLVTDNLGKPHLVVIEEKSFMLTIMKTVELPGRILKIEKVFEEMMDDYISDSIRIVSSFDAISSRLAIQFCRSYIIFITFSGEKPIVMKEYCKAYHAHSLGWMNGNNEDIKLISTKRGFDTVSNRKIAYEECIFNPKDTKQLSERVDVTKNLHSGHLILVPAPIFGVVILGKKYISYFNNSNSDPVTNEITVKKELKYLSFSILGTNKILFVDNENVMYLSRLVVKHEWSTEILLFHTQIIEKDIKITNMYAIDEFSIMMEIENGTWKYGYLKRQRPGIRYNLEIMNEMREKNEDVASPPLKAAGYGQPNVVQKVGKPDIGDILNKKWEVVKMMGGGSYGSIHAVQEVLNKKMYVLKTQRIIPKEPSIENELAFLKKITSLKDKSGFPELMDEFVWCGKWHLFVITNEGKSLLDFINMNSCKRFSESNISRIGFQATNILLKMHEIGFVHRDYHVENLLVKMVNKTIVLTSIDYGFTMMEKDTKPQEFMCHPYASLGVCKGERSTKRDDLFSMHNILMICGGQSEIFNIKDNKALIDKKKKFDEDPSKYFNESQKWMANLYKLIKNITSNDKEPAKTLLGHFEKGMVFKNVRPNSPIEYTKVNVIEFTIN